MRISLATRVGAVLATATLAAGATAVPAGAADTPDVPRVDARLATFRLSSSIITARTTTQFFGSVTLRQKPSSRIVSATTAVTIDGRPFRPVPLVIGNGGGGVDLPRGWGAGTVRLGPTTFTYEDGTSSVDPTRSSPFHARKDVRTLSRDDVALVVTRRGSRHVFRAKRISVVRPSTGTYGPLRSVKLQYADNYVWKTKKVIRLDARGNGTVVLENAGTYRWRLFSPQTPDRVGFTSLRTDRI